VTGESGVGCSSVQCALLLAGRLGQQDAPDDFSKNALDSGFLAVALKHSNCGNDIPEEQDARNVTTNLEK
jgi:hypothetical protein